MLVQPDPGLIFWTIVTFLILLFILKKFAWKPLLAALQKREETISNALQKAEDAKNEAEKILEENRAKLAAVESQAQKVISDGRQMAEKLKNDMITEARNISDRLKKEATEEIEKSKDSALASIRSEISDIAIKAASKIISENLTDKVDRKLIDSFIDALPKSQN